jgi:hypothetical protein
MGTDAGHSAFVNNRPPAIGAQVGLLRSVSDRRSPINGVLRAAQISEPSARQYSFIWAENHEAHSVVSCSTSTDYSLLQHHGFFGTRVCREARPPETSLATKRLIIYSGELLIQVEALAFGFPSVDEVHHIITAIHSKLPARIVSLSLPLWFSSRIAFILSRWIEFSS